MDPTKTPMLALEAVETPETSLSQSDKMWTRGRIREEIDREWSRSVVECGNLANEDCIPQEVF